MRRAGFTLIEISIVLVIIGLIIGGVLVGQDLIKAASIRATISQIEKFNTASHTFQIKYGGLPGDLEAAKASAFGLTTSMFASPGALGQGDGNGLIEAGASTSATPSGVALSRETLAFWRQLGDANLIEGSFGNATSCATKDACAALIPTSKLGNGNLVIINAAQGFNYYGITGINSATGYYANACCNSITPQDAYSIDSKVDDGLPFSGLVQPFDMINTGGYTAGGYGGTGAAFWLVPSSASNTLTTCATAGAYVLSGSDATSSNCSLRWRFN